MPGSRTWPRTSSARSPMRSMLVAESGTGTGKTFAYLVPALLSGGKVHRVDRHQDAAGPAVPSATCRRCATRCGVPATRGAAQGPRQLRLPPPPRARRRRRPLPLARGRAAPARRSSRFAHEPARGDRGELADVPENARDLAAGHLDARQLPRQRLPALTTTAS
ncbi:MAG: hypothetical protein MZV65_17790 [Chromatiales bacterium]|nr:hypothetical protein [Chromatiales bacterium]